jgi:hypothetical protein
VKQRHLNYTQQVNLGSYYTKPELVQNVYTLLQKNIADFGQYTILDNSCGYGSFLDFDIANKKIGADIDKSALEKVKSDAVLINHNSLAKIKRCDYDLSDDEKVIIVGNPPYNDTTSIIKHQIKRERQESDTIKMRDMGISFLLSYNALKVDFICVLHPLSYLIKQANFKALGEFAKNYKLLDCQIISSMEFTDKMSSTFFPILIALYGKGKMDYDFIKNYDFKVEDKSFAMKDFVSISNFVSKYPNQKLVREKDAAAKFYTMRDINALKRSKTFMKDTTYNTIFVRKEKLEYYCYVDIFKKFIPHIPYYFGNCDVMIDDDKFQLIKDCFVRFSAEENAELRKYCKEDVKFYKEKINDYFLELLGKHFVKVRR